MNRQTSVPPDNLNAPFCNVKKNPVFAPAVFSLTSKLHAISSRHRWHKTYQAGKVQETFLTTISFQHFKPEPFRIQKYVHQSKMSAAEMMISADCETVYPHCCLNQVVMQLSNHNFTAIMIFGVATLQQVIIVKRLTTNTTPWVLRF